MNDSDREYLAQLGSAIAKLFIVGDERFTAANQLRKRVANYRKTFTQQPGSEAHADFDNDAAN